MPLPSPLYQINHSLFQQHKLEVMIKRDDLIHPIISGNKWRKLKFNIDHVTATKKKGIISFGGAYSNHIHALAFACYTHKIPCVGIIRGESHYLNNYTLRWATYWNMSIEFVDRETYRLRNDEQYLASLQAQYPDYLIVPEGGSNALALPGVGEVINELNHQTTYDTLITPVGSGGTLAGLITADNNKHKLLGISVLKENQSDHELPPECSYLTKTVAQLLPDHAKEYDNWKIFGNFHRGGYAKFSALDSQRLLTFSQETQLDFEPVYSGKMVLALLDLVAAGFFSEGQRIVMLHTGGLQGIGGLIERKKLKAQDWTMPIAAPQS